MRTLQGLNEIIYVNLLVLNLWCLLLFQRGLFWSFSIHERQEWKYISYNGDGEVTTRGPKPRCELSFGEKHWAARSDLLNTGGSKKERNPVACVTSASRQRLDRCSCIGGHLSQQLLLPCFSPPHPRGPAAFQGIKGTCFSWDFGTGGMESATESVSFMSLSSFSSETGKEQVQTSTEHLPGSALNAPV